jgi:mono/diheme cytochrome c family protein
MFRRWAWTEGLLSAAVIVTGAVAASALVPGTVLAGDAPAGDQAKPAEQAPADQANTDSSGHKLNTDKPYKLYPGGKVDFATYRGYNMYSSICFVCHGPDAMGSSFAPRLMDSLKYLSYEDFVSTVMNGRVDITSTSNNAMPSFGDNPTVAKYVDSLYAYLKARADGVLKPGVPEWEGPKD